MSRSYKKHPYCCDSKGKIKKRFANKSVRSFLKRNADVPLKRNNYKKIHESYLICDYYWRFEFDEFLNRYNSDKDKKIYTNDELYKMWYKWYRMK